MGASAVDPRPRRRRCAAAAALLLAGAALCWPLALATLNSALVVAAEDLLPAGALPDAIVVLGFDIGEDDQLLSPTLRARAEAAFRLVRERDGVALLLTGGVPQGRRVSEAVAVHRWMVSRGLRSSVRVFLEANSTSTLRNARLSLPVIRAQRWRHVALVTSPYHQWRALRTFRRELARAMPELRVRVSVVPAAAVLEAGHHSGIGFAEGVRELLAVALYFVMGWLA